MQRQEKKTNIFRRPDDINYNDEDNLKEKS
jgi:hypothetical protein